MRLFCRVAAVIFICQIFSGLGHEVNIESHGPYEIFAAVIPKYTDSEIGGRTQVSIEVVRIVQGRKKVYYITGKKLEVGICWIHQKAFFSKEIEVPLRHRPSTPQDHDEFHILIQTIRITLSNTFRFRHEQIYYWEPDELLNFCERWNMNATECGEKFDDMVRLVK